MKINRIPADGLVDDELDMWMFKVPERLGNFMVNLLCLGKWMTCSESDDGQPWPCAPYEELEQCILSQAYHQGGPDAVWKNPQKGSFHHPTLEEQDGEAWDIVKEYDEKVSVLRVVETGVRILALQDKSAHMTFVEKMDQYESVLWDIYNEKGMEGLMTALIGFRAQENS